MKRTFEEQTRLNFRKRSEVFYKQFFALQALLPLEYVVVIAHDAASQTIDFCPISQFAAINR